jgi:Lrp/AsnC family leucine-responsive transcriptional regulator
MTNFDDIDLRLLRALQLDASQSNEALAAKVFTSPATALRRVRTLKTSGVIEAVVATLTPAHFNGIVNAICEITLDQQNAESFAAFEALIERESQVTQCYQTHPSVDYTLVLTLARLDDYNDLVRRVFTAANNVRNVRTRFATKRTKATFALPI